MKHFFQDSLQVIFLFFSFLLFALEPSLKLIASDLPVHVPPNLTLPRPNLNPGAIPISQFGSTPIYAASRAGHLHIVECLLERGADVNRAHDVSQSAWQWCRGCVRVVLKPRL